MKQEQGCLVNCLFVVRDSDRLIVKEIRESSMRLLVDVKLENGECNLLCAIYNMSILVYFQVTLKLKTMYYMTLTNRDKYRFFVVAIFTHFVLVFLQASQIFCKHYMHRILYTEEQKYPVR